MPARRSQAPPTLDLGLSPRQCSVRHRMRGGLRVWGPQVLGEVAIQGQDSGEGPTST